MYTTIKRVKDLNIKFLENEQISEYLLKISGNLLMIDPSYSLLDHDDIFRKFDEKAIHTFYDSMSYKKVVIIASNTNYKFNKTMPDKTDFNFL